LIFGSLKHFRELPQDAFCEIWPRSNMAKANLTNSFGLFSPWGCSLT
jgi:hypothetical protein